jgi:HK97 family phage major capsid protein
VRTIEEILAELQAIIDGAEGRSLTDDEVTNYEALETELQNVRRTNEIQARNTAYNTVIVPAGVPRPAPSAEDTLDTAFEAYLRTGQPNADIAGLRVTNDQGVGTSAGGGYTVPSGFRKKLVEVMQSFGGLAAEVDSFNTDTGNPIEYPSLDDTANEGDIAAEGAVADGDDLVFGTVTLGAHKYTAAGTGTATPLRVSVELLQDSAFDIVGLVTRAMGTRIARKQAAHWCTGTGVAQPKGIVASSLTADRDLDTADTLDYEDLLETQDLLDEAYESNAKWLMKRNTWSQIRLILDGNNRPLIMGRDDSIAGAPRRMLLDRPVVIDEAMPTLSSAGDTFPIAYGDLREAYVIRRVQNLVVVVNPWTRAAQGQVEFSGWERADGNIQNRSAYVILQNNT